MVTGDKPEGSRRKNDEWTPSREAGDKHNEESASSIKSHRKGDMKKKKMKKVVYYETDSSSPSHPTPSLPLRSAKSARSIVRCLYAILAFQNAPILSVPLGKPPYFDGEDYCMWSDKMRHHLTSLHESIWDIVEFGAQAPQVGNKDYNSDEAA
jgi:hypothetical protein